LSCTVQVANHRKATGLVYAGVRTAANAGVPGDQAGLAAALITISFQLGSAHSALAAPVRGRQGVVTGRPGRDALAGSAVTGALRGLAAG
jgi:hypothetical protein